MNNSVYDAAKIMAEKDIGTLVVIRNDEPIGIITERDLVKRIKRS